MQLWLVLTSLALTAISVSGQSLGRNYGVNVRLSQRGLSYAAQKAANDLYDKYRNEAIPNIEDNSGKTRYKVSNIRIPSLSRPTFNLRINPGQGVSPMVTINNLRVTGNFQVRRKFAWIWWRKSGSFIVTASAISINTAFGVGSSRGRPVVSARSCSSSIGSFKIDIGAGGFVGWIINLFEGTISRRIKRTLEPKLCDQIRKLVPQMNQKLATLKVTTRLQDGRLLLDYSLLRAPVFTSNYIDTTVKGDVTWKGRRTGTPTATRSWPAIPGSSNKMATIYITDYIMNALGVLLHNDNSLSYNVTRNQVSSSIRPWLALSCQSICAGAAFPQLAAQYPDGWLEAGLRTNSPPRLTIGSNVVTGRFSGILEVYVRRPNGQKIRVATATAQITLPLSLTISNNMLKASVRNPSISVTPGQASTPGLAELLKQISEGFVDVKLNEIGQKGFELPSYKDVSFINPQIYIRSGVIAVSTDINYRG